MVYHAYYVLDGDRGCRPCVESSGDEQTRELKTCRYVDSVLGSDRGYVQRSNKLLTDIMLIHRFCLLSFKHRLAPLLG